MEVSCNSPDMDGGKMPILRPEWSCDENLGKLMGVRST